MYRRLDLSIVLTAALASSSAMAMTPDSAMMRLAPANRVKLTNPGLESHDRLEERKACQSIRVLVPSRRAVRALIFGDGEARALTISVIAASAVLGTTCLRAGRAHVVKIKPTKKHDLGID